MEAGNLWKNTIEAPMVATDIATNTLSRIVNVPGNIISKVLDYPKSWVSRSIKATADLTNTDGIGDFIANRSDNLFDAAKFIVKYPGQKTEQILKVGGHIAKSAYYIPAGFVEKIPTGLNLASGDVFAPFSESISRTINVGKAIPNTALETAKIIPTVGYFSNKIANVLGWGKDKTSGMFSGIKTEPFDAKPNLKYSWAENN